MKTFALALIALLFTACTSTSPSPVSAPATAPSPKNADASSEKVLSLPILLTNAPATSPCLRVIVPTSLSLSAQKPGQFYIKVVNLLEDEIFLDIEAFSAGPIQGEFQRAPGPGNDFLVPSSGPSFNTYSPSKGHYILLHKGYSVDGKTRTTCGCGMAYIRTYLDQYNLDFGPGATGTITFYLSGYLRHTGQAFHMTINSPMTLTK